MSLAFTSAGTKLSVSAALPATFDVTGYAALTWKEVGEIVDMGEFGKEYSQVTHNPLGSRQTIKRKGSYNEGSLALKMARVPSDDGQAILVAAVDSDDSVSVKVELQDGTIMYTTAQVMGYKTGVGSADQITSATCALEIDRPIVEDPA
jgi:hypothetical protein